MLGLKWTEVILVPHDKAWTEEFQHTKEEIARIWGENALSIEHVGSTSIKNISAKPIIDVAVVVEKFSSMDIAALESVGYKYMGARNEQADRFMFAKYAENSEDIVTHHIHIYEPNNPNYIFQLGFRDYLNSHPEKARLYNEIKISAADSYSNDRYAYSDAMRGFIENVIEELKNMPVENHSSNNKKRKAVFMDIDGTLMYNGRISERVIDAIRKARMQGHMFFVCTGRSKGYLPEILRDADFIDGFVMSCGMYCEINGETVFRELIALEDLRRAARYFCDNGRECHFDGETKMLGLNSQRQDFVRFDDFDDITAEFMNESISKMTIPGAYREEDGRFFSGKFTVYDMGGWSDVVKTGVTKATGMQIILDHVGIDQADSIGIGDGSNDLPMIKYAGLGVAMGNAPEHVKAEADVVTETCENDGVAVMIEKYVIGENNAEGK